MQRFRVDLKTFLGLAMPNQCRHTITKLILGWFVGGIFRQKTPNIYDSYSTTVLYDTENSLMKRAPISRYMKAITPGNFELVS